MPTYVTLYRYTRQGITNVKDSPARIEKARKAVEQAGGKLKAVYVTMGRFDLVAISEWPSAEVGAAFSLRQAAEGNVTTETLRAFDEDEFRRIVSKV